MVVGTTLLKLDGNPYYSPQFNRGGNAGQFSSQVLNIAGVSGFDIDVEHKNAEDTAWTTLVSFSTMTTTGIYNANGAAVKEQLRFKYTVAGANIYAGVHFNMLAPQWRPY